MSSDDPSTRNVAVVVGGAGELGRATAVKLASLGMTVVAVDRNQSSLDQLPQGIAQEWADATDPEAVSTLIDRITKNFGVPNVLVNTIGAFESADALTTTSDQFRHMIDVNLAPALWLSQAVAPFMKTRGSGSIVHITARPGLEPTAGLAAYSVSKAALVHLTRILDLELRPLGIRVNAVAPLLIATARNKAFLPQEALAHAVTPEAIAEVVAFLASDAAAPVSGAILPAYGA
jgi:NAD(P)-dependent dehydrogenase (short-subunit alcohol dehydrogenase family)